MAVIALQNIAQVESSLWEAADQLRANSKLTSSISFVLEELKVVQ